MYVECIKFGCCYASWPKLYKGSTFKWEVPVCFSLFFSGVRKYQPKSYIPENKIISATFLLQALWVHCNVMIGCQR